MATSKNVAHIFFFLQWCCLGNRLYIPVLHTDVAQHLVSCGHTPMARYNYYMCNLSIDLS